MDDCAEDWLCLAVCLAATTVDIVDLVADMFTVAVAASPVDVAPATSATVVVDEVVVVLVVVVVVVIIIVGCFCCVLVSAVAGVVAILFAAIYEECLMRAMGRR